MRDLSDASHTQDGFETYEHVDNWRTAPERAKGRTERTYADDADFAGIAEQAGGAW